MYKYVCYKYFPGSRTGNKNPFKEDNNTEISRFSRIFFEKQYPFDLVRNGKSWRL